MRIRAMQAEDLPRMQEITVAAFEHVSIDQRIDQTFGELNGHDWRWRKGQAIVQDWQREPEGLFVAEQAGLVVGGITTWHDAAAGIGYIPNLAIDAAYRGQGIGRQLLEYAIDRFRDLGLSLARIETLAHNEVGDHLYRSLGFQEVARQIHFAMKIPGSEA
ncbi:MAG: N-acetyltransferase [Planctomycetaceae bacterium]|nr:GNAT family N-acetyltransferase [Planctomycetaceae bacterium]